MSFAPTEGNRSGLSMETPRIILLAKTSRKELQQFSTPIRVAGRSEQRSDGAKSLREGLPLRDAEGMTDRGAKAGLLNQVAAG